MVVKCNNLKCWFFGLWIVLIVRFFVMFIVLMMLLWCWFLGICVRLILIMVCVLVWDKFRFLRVIELVLIEISFEMICVSVV